jgi:hypothetical protein
LPQAHKFFRPLDALMIALVGAAACWGILTFRFTEGARAVVYVANKKFAWYDLAGEKREVDVPTAIGTVKLEIGGGGARVVSSPCPNKLCVKTGTVRHSHEEIVCLPAQLLLVLEGGPGSGSGKGGTDAITY